MGLQSILLGLSLVANSAQAQETEYRSVLRKRLAATQLEVDTSFKGDFLSAVFLENLSNPDGTLTEGEIRVIRNKTNNFERFYVRVIGKRSPLEEEANVSDRATCNPLDYSLPSESPIFRTKGEMLRLLRSDIVTSTSGFIEVENKGEDGEVELRVTRYFNGYLFGDRSVTVYDLDLSDEHRKKRGFEVLNREAFVSLADVNGDQNFVLDDGEEDALNDIVVSSDDSYIWARVSGCYNGPRNLAFVHAMQHNQSSLEGLYSGNSSCEDIHLGPSYESVFISGEDVYLQIDFESGNIKTVRSQRFRTDIEIE
jgi:hypothetical protein